MEYKIGSRVKIVEIGGLRFGKRIVTVKCMDTGKRMVVTVNGLEPYKNEED